MADVLDIFPYFLQAFCQSFNSILAEPKTNTEIGYLSGEIILIGKQLQIRIACFSGPRHRKVTVFCIKKKKIKKKSDLFWRFTMQDFIKIHLGIKNQISSSLQINQGHLQNQNNFSSFRESSQTAKRTCLLRYFRESAKRLKILFMVFFWEKNMRRPGYEMNALPLNYQRHNYIA